MKQFPFKLIYEWYKIHGRHTLPWRQYFEMPIKDIAYRVWLSEIILQQTQVSRALQYYDKILKTFPHIEDLANVQYEDFFPYYKGLGYYSRARNMLKTAEIISKKYGGTFPHDRFELISLPGIGEYTADAIRAFAYEIPGLSFDTNLLKIFSRFYYGTRLHSLSKKEKEKIQNDFIKTHISSREMNAALMDFASLVSLNNKSHIDFSAYPIKNCHFYLSRGETENEKTHKNQAFPIKEAWIQVHLHENHKNYFSENLDTYVPFLLAPTRENTRTSIKRHFLNNFGLDVSVRPISKRWEENGKFFILCNVQIQKGTHSFGIYSKEEKKSCT